MSPFPHIDNSEIEDVDVKDILDAHFAIRILWLSNSPPTQASTISLLMAPSSSQRANSTT